MRGHITKRGKRYYAVVDVGVDERGKRKQKWISGFATRADAERGLTETLASLDQGTYVEPSRLSLERYLLDEWLPARAARIRGTTVDSYRYLIKRHVVPALGPVPLAQLTPVALTKFYGSLLTTGRVRGSGDLSPRTVRYVHSILRKALSDAVGWRLLPSNPCDGAVPPSAAAVRSPEMKVWTAEQLRAFLDFTRDDRDYIAWHLAASCGLRRGEVCGLRWSDLALDATPPTLAVRQQLVESMYRLTFAPPKTARGKRLVVLDPVTVAALRAHRRRQAAERLALGAAYQEHDLVVARLDGTPVYPNNLGQHFKRQVEKSGLPPIRFHDLRHTHATLAFQAGVHPKIVSERLGHASTSFTLDVYSHATPSMQQQAAGRDVGTPERLTIHSPASPTGLSTDSLRAPRWAMIACQILGVRKVLVLEEAAHRHTEPARQRDHDIESRVGPAVLDRGQVRPADARAFRKVALTNAGRLAEFSHAPSEPDAWWLTRKRDIARHVGSLRRTPPPARVADHTRPDRQEEA